MEIFKIEENDANQRLDKFLKKLFPNATRSLIYKLNRKEKIKIKPSSLTLFTEEEGDNSNKFKKKDNEYKLQIWDEVKIFLSDEEFEKLSCIKGNSENKELLHFDWFLPLQKWHNEDTKNVVFPRPLGEGRVRTKELDKNDIVFEDSHLLVLNKPAWINVHPGDFKTKEISVIQQVQDYLWDKLNSLTFKPSLVHRIDRDTSGILIIAKKKDILSRLMKDFKDHKKVKKTYYAIVLWKLSRNEWTIKKKLERIENAQNENKVQISENWQIAITHYKLLKEHNLQTKEGNITISELEVEIETWRMHQIRVHLASLWNPILWDKNYWDKKMNAFFSRNFWLNRQALHAWKIEFFHYWREKDIQLEARVKEDLKSFVGKLDWKK